MMRAPAVMPSGAMLARASGDGSPTVTRVPPAAVAVRAVSNARGWPAASMTTGAVMPWSATSAGLYAAPAPS